VLARLPEADRVMGEPCPEDGGTCGPDLVAAAEKHGPDLLCAVEIAPEEGGCDDGLP
jgi:hypothetical protein